MNRWKFSASYVSCRIRYKLPSRNEKGYVKFCYMIGTWQTFLNIHCNRLCSLISTNFSLFQANGSFKLTETDFSMDSDSDSKPDGYIVHVLSRTCLHRTDWDSYPYSLFLYRTGIWVQVYTRVCLRQCNWAITSNANFLYSFLFSRCTYYSPTSSLLRKATIYRETLDQKNFHRWLTMHFFGVAKHNSSN